MIGLHLMRVVDVVGSRFCIASDDGEKVFVLVRKAIEQTQPITLSFAGVEDLSTAFLKEAIGQLYGQFTSAQIQDVLSIVDIEPDDAFLIERVIERAKQYYADPSAIEKLERLIERELGLSGE